MRCTSLCILPNAAAECKVRCGKIRVDGGETGASWGGAGKPRKKRGFAPFSIPIGSWGSAYPGGEQVADGSQVASLTDTMPTTAHEDQSSLVFGMMDQEGELFQLHGQIDGDQADVRGQS